MSRPSFQSEAAFGKFKVAIGNMARDPDFAAVLITDVAHFEEMRPRIIEFGEKLITFPKEPQWRAVRLNVLAKGLLACRDGILKQQGVYFQAEASLLLGKKSEAVELLCTLTAATDTDLAVKVAARLAELEK